MEQTETANQSWRELIDDVPRDYAAILASVTAEEQAAFRADIPDSEFDHAFALPDGRSIAARDLRAEHLDPIYAANKGDLPIVCGLAWVAPALAQGLGYPEACLARYVAGKREDHEREAGNARQLASWQPGPSLPDEDTDYRAELDSMDERERAAAAKLIEQHVDGLYFECAPGDLYRSRAAVSVDDLDGIEALNPHRGELFDMVRPRMRQGLTYSEAVVSIALGNTRRHAAGHFDAAGRPRGGADARRPSRASAR
jgi:hypothetical protein